MSWSFTSKILRIKLIFKNCVYFFYITSWKTVYFRLVILLEEHVDFLNHSSYTVYKFIMHDFIMQYQNIFRFLSAIILFTIGTYFSFMFFHLMIYNCVLYFPYHTLYQPQTLTSINILNRGIVLIKSWYRMWYRKCQSVWFALSFT